jgi:transcriptional regulator with XRE-family HTH domain
MDETKRKRLEAAGFVIGDFEQFATEVLGMSVAEARETQFRADLGSAIRRIRDERGQARAKFARAIGSSPAELARLEVGAPEISLDLMLKAYFAAGGLLRYEFDSPAVAPPAEKTGPEAAAAMRPARKPAKSAGPGKAAKALKA